MYSSASVRVSVSPDERVGPQALDDRPSRTPRRTAAGRPAAVAARSPRSRSPRTGPGMGRPARDSGSPERAGDEQQERQRKRQQPERAAGIPAHRRRPTPGNREQRRERSGGVEQQQRAVPRRAGEIAQVVDGAIDDDLPVRADVAQRRAGLDEDERRQQEEHRAAHRRRDRDPPHRVAAVPRAAGRRPRQRDRQEDRVVVGRERDAGDRRGC